MSAVFAQQAALLSRRVTTHAERCSSAPSDGASRLRSVGVELDESVVMMANVALVVVLITLVLRERHRAPRTALPSLCPQRRPLTRPLMQCAAWARAAAAAELWTMRCWSGCRTAARRRSSTRCARARPRPPRPRACHYGSRS